MNEENLDNVCWCIVNEIDNWRPPKETAENCCEHFEEKAEEVEEFEFDAESAGWELGYHVAMDIQARQMADYMFKKLEIDVLQRAMNYIEESDELEEPEFNSAWFQGLGSDYWYRESEYDTSRWDNEGKEA